jgi:hypothetical protein
MPADPEQTARLRELHDDYAWKVNAAVAEGREDLIQRLSDEYVEEAARILADGTLAAGRACERAGCQTCGRPHETPAAAPQRRRWLDLLAAAGALARPAHWRAPGRGSAAGAR